jgi:hypothetical protein
MLAALLHVAACSPNADGRVLDVDGNPQAGCVIGAAQLFDAAGQRVRDASPVLTRSDADGHWSLSGLTPGTHLIFAWQPAKGSEAPGTGELIGLAKAFAKGSVPASGRYARRLATAERNATETSVDLSLGLHAEEGVHLAGDLAGPLLADRLVYVVSASVNRGESPTGTENGFTYEGSGGRLMRTAEFLGIADERGHFDLGWVLGGDLVSVSVTAAPAHCARLAQLGVALDRDMVDAEITVPRHEIRRVRVTGFPASTRGPDRGSLSCWAPGGSRWWQSPVPDAGIDVVVQAGGMLFQAAAIGYASSFIAVEPSIDDTGGEVLLDLLPEPPQEVTLVDEAGQPIPGAWIFIGTEATAGFTDPFPMFSVTDEEGKLSYPLLSPGSYPAQLVHDKGSYDEWRVDFAIDVQGPQTTVTVPLSAKYSVR